MLLLNSSVFIKNLELGIALRAAAEKALRERGTSRAFLAAYGD